MVCPDNPHWQIRSLLARLEDIGRISSMIDSLADDTGPIASMREEDFMMKYNCEDADVREENLLELRALFCWIDAKLLDIQEISSHEDQ